MMSPPVNNDPVSLLQLAGHNPVALAQLVENEQPALRTWLMHIVRDSDLVDDALQETWLTLSQGEWRFAARSDDATGDARAWLRQIVLRSALRLRKKQSTHQRHILRWWSLTPKNDEQITPLEHIAERDRQDMVWALIAELPTTMRDSIELHFRDGLNFSEVGKAQGCSALTARVRTWRAVQQLRKHLLLLGVLVLPGPLLGMVSMHNPGSATTSVNLFNNFFPATQRFIFHITPQQLAFSTIALTAVVSTILIGGLFLSNNTDEASIAGQQSRKSIDDSNKKMLAAMLITKNNKDTLGLSNVPDSVASEVQLSNDNNVTRSQGQILFTCKIFISPELGQLHSAHMPTVISHEQLDAIEQLLSQSETEILSAPTIITESGQSGTIQMLTQQAYCKGYSDIDDEKMRKGLIDPLIDELTTGLRTSLTGNIDGADIILTQANTKKSELLDLKEGKSILLHTDIDAHRMYSWDEPTVTFSQSIPLPEKGLRVPLGHSVLVPVKSGVIQRGSPQGVSNAPDSKLKPWYLLVTPLQIREEPPTLPNAST